MILHVNPINPQQRLLRVAVERLRDGDLIAFPTDTVYGLGCSVMEKKAMERLYQLKRYDKGHPMALLFADFKSVAAYARMSTPAYKIMRHLLPGPYTFILEATREVPKLMLSRQKTVGIRVPDNLVAQELVREMHTPIMTTSAELDDHGLLLNAEDIEAAIGRQLGCVVDGGVLPDERSTIVDLSGDEPVLLRAGKGPFEM
ncbi:MAG: threonylcarbamoyl-AMP synthase [Candidatus Zixiibacteriota bacterium]|nr:MAG: threonylcarbamoyl-AMP synthase [candidate division Zixibacteria bacterium]